MKSSIVDDGLVRLLKGRSARNTETVRARYAAEWARKNFLQRLWLRYVIWHEAKELDAKEPKPSPGTLW